MTVRDLLQILRGGWIIILVATVAAVAIGTIYTSTRTPQYQAAATLAVSACVAVENLDSCDPVSGLSYAAERARIYAGTALSAPVLRLTLDHSDIVADRKELAGVISVTQEQDSPLIEVSAMYTDAESAARLANAFAEALIEHSRESIDNFESVGTNVSINVVSPALAPIEPLGGESRTILLTALLGLLLGLGIAVLRWLLNSYLRDTFDAERVSGLDVLAEIPLRKAGKNGELDRDSTRVADAFHALRAIVASRRPERDSWTIAVVTPADASLASAVSDGLVDSLAASRQSAVLLRLHSSGLSEPEEGDVQKVLKGDISPAAFLDSFRGVNPISTTLFSSSSDPAADLSTPEFAELLAAARDRAAIVLLDAAPESRGAEMVTAAGQADATLIVVESGRTRTQELTKIIRALELVQAPPIGLVVVSSGGSRV